MSSTDPDELMTIDDILEAFDLLDDWEERYRYLIELGRDLDPLPAEAHNAANKVEGCASQVWLETTVEPGSGDGPVLRFRGDSDAHIVRGLVAVIIALYSGKTAAEIVAIDAPAVLDRLGLKEHLSPQRSNGLRSMVARIRTEATRALTYA